MVLYHFIGQLTDDEIARAHFQEDSAAGHTAHASMAPLRDVFSDQLISGTFGHRDHLTYDP